MKYTISESEQKIQRVSLGGKSLVVGELVELNDDEAKLASEYFVLSPPVKVAEEVKEQEDAPAPAFTKVGTVPVVSEDKEQDKAPLKGNGK